MTKRLQEMRSVDRAAVGDLEVGLPNKSRRFTTRSRGNCGMPVFDDSVTIIDTRDQLGDEEFKMLPGRTQT